MQVRMLKDNAYLAWLREQPSRVSKEMKDIVAAHMVSRGARGDDYHAVSVTDEEHKYQHQKGIETFEWHYGVDRRELIYQSLIGYIQYLYEIIVYQKQKYKNAVRQHRRMFEDTRGHDMYKYQIDLDGETFESPSFEAVMKRAKEILKDSVVIVSVLTDENEKGEWLQKQDLEVQIRPIKIDDRVAA